MVDFLLLTEEHVKSVLPMSDLVAAMESALARFSSGEVQQPVRTVLTVGAQKSWWGLMPAYVNDPATMGAKLVTVFNGNSARALPTHLAIVVLFDPDTGALQALMDGRYITEARTAAVSAVSARHLARGEAATLAIIGAGVQARSHLEALAEVRRLRDVRVWSPNAASRERFVAEMSAHALAPLRATTTAEEAVSGADLVVLATSSPTPVVDVSWIAPGSHIVSVGACRPDQREMAPELVARARLFVDSRAAALVESGDVVMGMAEGRFGPEHIVGELGALVLGRAEGRQSRDQITIFKSLGMAVEDVAAADLAYRRAIEHGVGSRQVL
jgi:alanine dehydrogenase